ncbi:T9SS type A sorting domain-containing protein [candidate division KSB1 bacterium]|nr:T9SS type A sorting domain-containing protein [candidate division KSB1 bacterium]
MRGINTTNCNNTYFYYNSVRTEGGSDNYTFYEGSHYSSDGLAHIVNNIFYNAGGGLALMLEQDAEQATDYLGTIDYNNYYTTGTNIAEWKTNQAATVSALNALYGKDAHSISKTVTFASSTDLHLAGGSIGDTDLIGTALAAVTTDYDGHTRHASYPYIGADENTGSPLPVEMITFSAIVVKSGVKLTWHTVSATNNVGFMIERKELDGEWEHIGFFEGHGTTNITQSYVYVDESIQNSEYYYRIKQIDADGTFQFSSEIKISVNLAETLHLSQNYPNPFNPSTTIQYLILEPALVELKIYNDVGQLVRTLVNNYQNTGEHSTVWDGTDYRGNQVTSGVYFYSIKIGDYMTYHKQMLLMK